MCVAATLILDTYDAFEEYCRLLSQDMDKSKVSVALLTRYIYESYVNFLYIFIVSKGHVQNRTKAFFNYGNYKHKKMRLKEEFGSQEAEWKKYVPKKSSKTQWHGRSFQEIAQEVKFSNIIYQFLSQFTHPGIFSLERIMKSDMFMGGMRDSIIFTSCAVCDMVSYAHNLKLYGIKNHQRNEKDITNLLKIHESYMKAHKAKNDHN